MEARCSVVAVDEDSARVLFVLCRRMAVSLHKSFNSRITATWYTVGTYLVWRRWFGRWSA